MAIGVTLLANSIAAVSSPFSTASVTPTAGAILFLHVSYARSSGAANETFNVSGLSGTWTAIHNGVYGARRGSGLYVCDDWSGSGSISIAPADPTAFQAGGYGLIEVTGLDAVTPYDGQVEVTDSSGSATSLDPTVSGVGSAGDATLAVLSIEGNVAVAPEGGWVELYDQGEPNGIRRMGLAWDADGDTTPLWTWSGGASAYGISLRLKTAAGGTSFSVTPIDDVGITDTVSILLGFSLSVTDNVGVTDDADVTHDVVIDGQTDPVGITDVTSVILGAIIDATDNVGITDDIGLVLQHVLGFIDPVGITDDAGSTLQHVLDLSDSVGITDDVATFIGNTLHILDPVALTDTVTFDVGTARADPVGITDVVVVGRNIIEDPPADPIGIVDSVTVSVTQLTVTFIDPVGITDSVVVFMPDTGPVITGPLTTSSGAPRRTTSTSTLDRVTVPVAR